MSDVLTDTISDNKDCISRCDVGRDVSRESIANITHWEILQFDDKLSHGVVEFSDR